VPNHTLIQTFNMFHQMCTEILNHMVIPVLLFWIKTLRVILGLQALLSMLLLWKKTMNSNRSSSFKTLFGTFLLYLSVLPLILSEYLKLLLPTSLSWVMYRYFREYSLKSVQVLLKSRIDFDFNMALYCAITYEWVEISEKLFQRGADLSDLNIHGSHYFSWLDRRDIMNKVLRR